MVGRQGFEPWKPMATDLQSAPFGHLGTCPIFSSVKISSYERPSFRISEMGKEEQANPRTAPPSLKFKDESDEQRSSLVQETADSIDEVM
jgi:hypothetical protein